MKQTYPFVILPESLKAIEDIYPPLPNKPQKPKKPTFYEPKKPKEPKKPTQTEGEAWKGGLLLSGFCLLIILFFGDSRTFWEDFFPFSLIIAIGIFGGFFLIRQYYVDIDYYYEANSKYKEDMKKYETNLMNRKYEHQKEMTLYHTKSSKYSEEVSEYEDNKKYLWSHEQVVKYRKKLVSDFFEETTIPSIVSNKYSVGVSEKAFFKFLQKKSNKFHQNLAIVEYEELEDFYVPDIVYYDKENGLLIDIEIDEPYLTSDGTPIHYIGVDDNRDEFFIDHSWIVIRFAEEQVVRYPNQCYQFIQKIIEKIKKIDFSETDFSCKINRWTKEEAHKMAFNHSRKSYLSGKLIEKYNNQYVSEDVLNNEGIVEENILKNESVKETERKTININLSEVPEVVRWELERASEELLSQIEPEPESESLETLQILKNVMILGNLNPGDYLFLWLTDYQTSNGKIVKSIILKYIDRVKGTGNIEEVDDYQFEAILYSLAVAHNSLNWAFFVADAPLSISHDNLLVARLNPISEEEALNGKQMATGYMRELSEPALLDKIEFKLIQEYFPELLSM